MARPSTTVQAISDFIAGCKADGVWSKITEAYLIAGVTFGGITVKLKGTGTLTNNNFVSGDYQATGAGAGLTGDGSTKYLDTGLNDNTLSADDKHLGYYLTVMGSYGTRAQIGTYDGGTNYWVLQNPDITTTQVGIPFTDALLTASHTTGSAMVSRRGVNDVELYGNGSSFATDTSTASATNANTSYYLFAFNNNNSNALNYSDATLTFAHVGTSLTDTDAENLSLRVNKLMYDLGCSTYIDSGTVAAMGLDSDVQTYANAVLTAGGNWEGV
jgi:hypothetical protein